MRTASVTWWKEPSFSYRSMMVAIHTGIWSRLGRWLVWWTCDFEMKSSQPIMARSLPQMRKRTSSLHPALMKWRKTTTVKYLARSTTKCIIVSRLPPRLMTPSLIIKHIIIYRRLLRNKELDMIERPWKSRCKRVWWEKWNDTWISTPIHGWCSPLEGILLYRQSGHFHTTIHAAYTIEMYSISYVQSG
jgi:hypothetical protein